MEPLVSGVAAVRTLAAARAAGAVLEGNDPSLVNLAAIIAPLPESAGDTLVPAAGDSEKLPHVPHALSDVAAPTVPDEQEIIIERKLIARQSSPDEQGQEAVVLEKRVDARYLDHGNLEDAWLDAQKGELSIDTLLLALVDVVDVLTLGLFRPMLLEIKVAPHLMARQVHYRAKVTYDTPVDTETSSRVTPEGTLSEETRVQRRLTQVEKLSVDVSPELFDRANISFAEAASRLQNAHLAEHTVVYSRLDLLTEKDIRLLSPHDQLKNQTVSQRLQSFECSDGRSLSLQELSPGEMQTKGLELLQDKERAVHTVVAVEQGPEKVSMELLSEEADKSWFIRKTETRHLRRSSELTRTITTDTRIVEHDHLAGREDVLEQHRQTAEQVLHSKADVTEKKTHFAPPSIFRGDKSQFLEAKLHSTLGEATVSTITPKELTATTTIREDGRELSQSTTELAPGEILMRKEYEKGTIADWYLIGDLGHAVSKASLAGVGELTASEVGWALFDTAGIALTVWSGGKAAAVMAPAKMAAKTAAKTIAKSLAKDAAQEALARAAGPEAGILGGAMAALPHPKSALKGTIKGSIRLGNNESLAKVSGQFEPQVGMKQTGKLEGLEIPKAGAKAKAPESGLIVHKPALPCSNGKWADPLRPGDSDWLPEPSVIPAKCNPNNLTYGEILPNGRITFRGGYPVFKPLAEKDIPHFTEQRAKNFAQADSGLAASVQSGEKVSDVIHDHLRKKGISPSDVTQETIELMRKDMGLTWHEMENMKTLQLVPSVLHANIHHSGGVSAYKHLSCH